MIDLDSSNQVLQRVTNTLSKDIMPVAIDEQTVYYLSDQKGIFNLYKYDLTNKLYTQVSKFSSSIKQFDISLAKGGLAYVMNYKGEDQLFSQGNFDLDQNNFTPQTKRQEIQQALFISERIRERREKELAELEEQPLDEDITLVQPIDEAADSLQTDEEVTENY